MGAGGTFLPPRVQKRKREKKRKKRCVGTQPRRHRSNNHQGRSLPSCMAANEYGAAAVDPLLPALEEPEIKSTALYSPIYPCPSAAQPEESRANTSALQQERQTS